jgi:hypothetical protein
MIPRIALSAALERQLDQDQERQCPRNPKGVEAAEVFVERVMIGLLSSGVSNTSRLGWQTSRHGLDGVERPNGHNVPSGGRCVVGAEVR